MFGGGEISLPADCPATLVPFGMGVILSKGTLLKLIEKSESGATVSGLFGVARINSEHSKAVLGQFIGELLEPVGGSPEAASANSEPAFDVDETELWEAAKTVFDPEIPVNIVDLGLLYRLEVKRDAEGRRIVEADMTLTAPGCAMGPAIAEDLRLRLSAVPWVSEAVVNIVWDPPWNCDMMSEQARMILGLA